jgi:pyrroline-5-carboxylate reductase
MNIQNIKIGIIGTGNMGGAIIRGIAAEENKNRIMIYDADSARLSAVQTETGVISASSADETVKFCNMLILSVKPDITVSLAAGLQDFSGIIISVAAGISISTLQNAAGKEKKIVRAMPNTPASIGCGMTVISPSDNVSENEIEIVKSIFASVGEVLVMDEKHMNAVTAISGSGPAYIFTFIQAMADAGVKLGIPRNEALILAAQTISGSAKMFLDKKENPI